MNTKALNRYLEIIEEYKSGLTLEEIGQKYGLTRERIRQLINEGLEYLLINNQQESTKEPVKSFILQQQQLFFNDKTVENPVDILHLSNRTLNILIKNKIYSVEDLFCLSLAEIKKIKGLGKKSFEELSKKITEIRSKDVYFKKENIFITHLELDDRSLNVLTKNEIFYVEDLIKFSKKELLFLPNLGKKVLDNIIEKLKVNNFELKEEKIDDQLEEEFEKIKKIHKKNKIKSSVGENIEEKRIYFVTKAKGYYSKVKFLSDLKITQSVLDEFFPEVLKIIEKNRIEFKKKWSRYYIKCLECGTTVIPHQSLGLCKKCYPKSEHFKEIQRLSHLKHREKRKDKVREYSKEYAKRPDIIEKTRKKDDLKNYGGNRENALKRNGYKCENCGCTREENYKSFNRDLCVFHIDGDKNNNSLNNLISLCDKCFLERFRGKN